ncbi:MAG TPA: type II toxin-antitoxin system prevent-host-death family antitoxin [Microbacteriaceae bacterium]|nr:type II toxin-antitoxin system prevent-host-death family antitoxin [Microbacteriaceae bacterium]
MREMTASEASRRFSAVLDRAERGETVIVTRAGRRVAVIGPSPRANGEALRAVFDRWRGEPALDDEFAERVSQVREVASSESDVDPWRE